MRMCHFPAQNGPFVMNKKILVQPIIISFIYLLVLFIVQNFKKFLLWIQSYEDASFLAQNDPFAQNNFFLKIINIILIYLLPTFIGQNFKKILPADPVMRMCNFWAQNSPFPIWIFFFRKPVNEPRFFHSCLSTCQKSKSDINLLVKYWQLKNTQISLAESHFQL